MSSAWFWADTKLCGHLFKDYLVGNIFVFMIAERISARLWIKDLFSQSTYVRTCICTWDTLRNVTQNVVTHHRYRLYVRHTVWHIQIRSTQIFDCGRRLLWWWRWRSGMTAQGGHRGLDTTNSFSFLRAAHISPAAPAYIWHAHIVCALARGKDAHAYS